MSGSWFYRSVTSHADEDDVESREKLVEDDEGCTTAAAPTAPAAAARKPRSFLWPLTSSAKGKQLNAAAAAATSSASFSGRVGGGSMSGTPDSSSAKAFSSSGTVRVASGPLPVIAAMTMAGTSRLGQSPALLPATSSSSSSHPAGGSSSHEQVGSLISFNSIEAEDLPFLNGGAHGGSSSAAPAFSPAFPTLQPTESAPTAGYYDDVFGDLRAHSTAAPSTVAAAAARQAAMTNPHTAHLMSVPSMTRCQSENGLASPSMAQEPESAAEAPPRDFEEDDNGEHGRRELLIYALPLYRGETVFLPISDWREAPKEAKTGMAGDAQKRMGAMKDHVTDKWDALKDKDPSTLGNKIWRAGQRMAENVSPTERLMRAIPKNVSRVRVYHSTQLSPDEVAERLVTMASEARLKSGAKATLAGLFLPVALSLDLLIIPGVHVLTAYTAWQLGKNASSTIGAQRMAAYVAQEGRGEKGVRVDYVPDPRLDKYVDVVRDSVDGVLAEEEIAGLAADLQQEALVEPMLELRARQIRMTTTKQDDYALLPSN